MKRTLLGLLSGIIFLSACGGNPPPSQPTTDSISSTPSPLPSSTPTITAPMLTQGVSITPLPTIPTFTPTFDVSTIVTVTPAPKAECPEENPSLSPTFYIPKHPECFDTDHCVFSGTEKEILEYLNKGGTVQSAISRLKTAIYGDYEEFDHQDVTNDGVFDLMFIDFSVFGSLHIIFCNGGNFEVFSSPVTGKEFFYGKQKIIVQDSNLNNIPEVTFKQLYGNQL